MADILKSKVAAEGGRKKNVTQIFFCIQHIIIDKVRQNNPFWHKNLAIPKYQTYHNTIFLISKLNIHSHQPYY